jgi:RHS repeat-associated protein
MQLLFLLLTLALQINVSGCEWQDGHTVMNHSKVIDNAFERGSFRPSAKLTDEKKYPIIADYLGTPVQMYDEKGKLTWEARLDIYGKVGAFAGSSLSDCPFRYQGQYHDAETDLYYNRFRYYDPDSANYLSQDPIGIEGGFAFYGYVHDTNSWIDAFGLRDFWVLTSEGTSKTKVIEGRTYSQHKSTGLWWSKDTAGHGISGDSGGSAFKIFKEGKGGNLEWYRDADKFGDFIDPNKKHKGPKGKKICGG